MQSRLDSLFEILEIKRDGLITDIKGQRDVFSKLEEYRGISIAYLKCALSNAEKAACKKFAYKSKNDDAR